MRVSPKAKIEKVASKDWTRPVLCSAYLNVGADDPDALKPVIVTPLNGTGIDGAVGIAMPIRVGSVVQMARTTVREMASYVMHARNAGIRAGVPLAQSWELDYASCYGGAAVSVNGGSGTLGEACMSSNRIPPSDFCRAMRILIDVLEDMPQVAAPSITEGGAA